jgi:hypothetical protein
MSITPEEAKELFRLRDIRLAELTAKASVELCDLDGLDRTGKCRVAGELWGKCSLDVKHALLCDAHHIVRSTAEMSVMGYIDEPNSGAVLGAAQLPCEEPKSSGALRL